MEHVAIMKKSWKLLPKIIAGEKKIESRWYQNKYTPWNKIKAGETIYFKDSGEPVTIKSKVKKVMQISNLTPRKVKEILNKYGQADGLGVKDIPRFYRMFKSKKYCLLIFLENSQEVKSFNIDKTGFGMMSAWISVDTINKIKIKTH